MGISRIFLSPANCQTPKPPLIKKSPGLYLPWVPKDNGLKKKYAEESSLEWYKVGSGQDGFTMIRNISEK